MEPTVLLSNNDGASPAAQDRTAAPDHDAPIPHVARKCGAKPAKSPRKTRKSTFFRRLSVYVNAAFFRPRSFAGGQAGYGPPSLLGDFSMFDRRQSARDKVMYGGVAEVGEYGVTKECVVRNISENGAQVEFGNIVRLPKQQMSLTIAKKGRSFLAKIIWWRDNFVGVAFSAEPRSKAPVSDLAERLRKSEQKKRQLQQRIEELLGER
jgi:hypothetical protein